MKKVLGMPVYDWTWVLLLALWKILIGAHLTLGVDEAHYVLYGLRPDWSYFDHPPMVGWVQWLFLTLLGKQEWVARLPAVLCGMISTLLIYGLVEKISLNKNAPRIAALALNASFLIAALWMMLLPDTILLTLALWLIFIVCHLLERKKFFDWVALGICLGLCGLTKYTAVFFVFSILGVVVSEKAIKKINPLGIIVASVLALVIVSPVFYWNMKHDWISFSYQQNHVMGSTKLNFEKFGIFLLTQFLAYSPFLIVSAFIGFLGARKSLNRTVRVILWIALPSLLFFAYTSLKDEVLPHWTIIGWALLIPVGVVLALESKKKVKWAVWASGLILIFALSELSFQFIKFPPYGSPYADLIGWRELRNDIKVILNSKENFGIAVTNWTHGSRANFYFSDLAPVFVLDERTDQFDIWEKSQRRPKNLLVLSWKGFDLHAAQAKKCQRLEPFTSKVFSINNSPVNSVTISLCENYSW